MDDTFTDMISSLVSKVTVSVLFTSLVTALFVCFPHFLTFIIIHNNYFLILEFILHERI